MKREPVGNEHDRDAWLGSTLPHLPAADAKDCLDAETLAAWADGGLNKQSAAAVELHVSTCDRCTGVLAALGRTAPALPARHAWSARGMWRWLVPVTAAAAAVAIWVVVPDRPVTPVSTTLSQDVELKSESAPGAENPSRNLTNRSPSPANRKPGAPAQEQFQARDDLRRAEPRTFGAAAGAAAPEAPPAAQAASSARAVSADMLKETVGTDPLIRWRIVAPDGVERSMDGGKMWSRTMSPVPEAEVVRAVDADRAVVTTTGGAVFYTTDGGASWTRVQENSTAPF
jgi:hypothetical protein